MASTKHYKRHSLREKTIWICSWLCFLAYPLAAQIKGRVTAQTPAEPVPFASLFINNTTYAQQCDADGVFELKNFPPPPFELTVTAVGYQSVTLQVGDNALKSPLLVQLQQKNIGLEEVTVISPAKDGWDKYGVLFTEEFIGYSPFAAQTRLLNKEALEFRYDRQKNILTVSAREPLKIRNNATGYEIIYWLEDFEFQASAKRTYFKGYTLFTPLTTRKKKQKAQWASNRLSAYKGSLNHFMRSVYRDSVVAEGFSIRRLKRITGSEYGKYVPVSTDSFLTGTDDGKRKLLKKLMTDTADQQTALARAIDIMKWLKEGTSSTYRFALSPVAPDTIPSREYNLHKADTARGLVVVSLFDSKRLSPRDSMLESMQRSGIIQMKNGSLRRSSDEHYDIVDPSPIVTDSIARYENGEVNMRFNDYLYIVYSGENEETAYQERQIRRTVAKDAPQASIISIAAGAAVSVMENGNFYNSYDLLTEGYWSYEKLDKLLPLDYSPEAAAIAD